MERNITKIVDQAIRQNLDKTEREGLREEFEERVKKELKDGVQDITALKLSNGRTLLDNLLNKASSSHWHHDQANIITTFGLT